MILMQLPSSLRASLTTATCFVALAITAVACSPTTTIKAGLNGGATATTPSTSDLAAISKAFDGAFDMPPSCPTVPVPGSYRFATDSDGTSWAYSTFGPGPNCQLNFAQKPVTNLATVPPFNNDPKGTIAATVRFTFERPSGESWRINAGSGNPFPCPASDGVAPGEGNGSFPKSVLQAWGLSYAQGCANVYFDQFPH